jgi:hypothetical protein
MGLHPSSSYSPDIKDMYYLYPYSIKLVKIIYNLNENRPIETYLNKDKYYLCKYFKPEELWESYSNINNFSNNMKKNNNQILFGFKKLSIDYVIQICDLDSGRKHKELLEWNPKTKIMNLLLEEKIINYF